MKILIIMLSVLITTAINYLLFVPSSPINLLLYLFIKENHTVYLLFDLAISNLLFLFFYKLLKKLILKVV